MEESMLEFGNGGHEEGVGNNLPGSDDGEDAPKYLDS
jgi:hypothetical protein